MPTTGKLPTNHSIPQEGSAKRMRRVPHLQSLRTFRYLDETHRAARRLYGRYPGVIGVGIGAKFINGKPTELKRAIHFYVTKKKTAPKRQLPKFIFERNSDGSIDHRSRVLTDVIELGTVRAVCGAGSRIDNTLGSSGTITLLFRNKAPGSNNYLFATCSHVAGTSKRFEAPSCCEDTNPAAQVIYRSEDSAGPQLDYDIAIAEMSPACSKDDLQVVGSSSAKLTHFLSRDAISAGYSVLVGLPSGIIASTVQGYSGALPIGTKIIDNCFILNMTATPGDSGSLLYADSYAIGMVIAVSEDGQYTFFHPLQDAIEFARQNSGKPIQVF